MEKLFEEIANALNPKTFEAAMKNTNKELVSLSLDAAGDLESDVKVFVKTASAGWALKDFADFIERNDYAEICREYLNEKTLDGQAIRWANWRDEEDFNRKIGA